MKEEQLCTRWFSYSVEDAKAAQAELDSLAAEGWELHELEFVTAQFRRTETPRPCWVEPARWRSAGRKDTEHRAEYLELCREAGWELMDETRGLWYFRARAGERPAPVQTDGTVEWETVWRKVLFDQAWNLLFIGIFWTVNFWVRAVWHGFFLWEPLLSSSALGATVLLQALMLAEVAYGVYLVCYRRRCRRAVREGNPLPVPGRAGARLRGSFRLWVGVMIAAAAVLLLSGAEEGQANYLEDYAGYTRQTSSVFAEHRTYHLFQDGRTWIEHYDCRFSWLADRICGDLLALEADEEQTERQHHYHPAVVPEAAELGFDRSWSYCAGDIFGLILRQGNQVIRVETDRADLTDADILVQLRERLLGPPDHGTE